MWRDHSAVLQLPVDGNETSKLTVETGGRFSIPFSRAEPEHRYRFASVDEEGQVVIEWNEGPGSKQLKLPAPAKQTD